VSQAKANNSKPRTPARQLNQEFSAVNPTKGNKESIAARAKRIKESMGFGEVPDDYSASASMLDLDKELAIELKELGLVPRWINAKKYALHGFHKSKWVPYKRESVAIASNLYVTAADGLTTKQDLVLAVKPAEWNLAHKKYLAKKAGNLKKSAETKAQDIRAFATDKGIDIKVHDGYEEN